MQSCPDPDALTGLVALGDDPEATLRHVIGCERCLDTLSNMALLRRECGAEVPLSAGFVASVMDALPAPEPATDTTSVRRRPTPAWWLANSALAAATGMLAAAAAGVAAPGAFGPAVLPLAVVAGLALTLWLERSRWGRDQSPAEA